LIEGKAESGAAQMTLTRNPKALAHLQQSAEIFVSPRARAGGERAMHRRAIRFLIQRVYPAG
jgi:hypothetical protein